MRSVTSTRQLRWIVWGTAIGVLPFALGYTVPFALGVTPSLSMDLLAVPLAFIPLAFASAIVRYRLMDVEVIVKRLLVQASKYLTREGILVVEVGDSEAALVSQYPHVPFLWLEFERGGEGVFLLESAQIKEFFG